VSETYEHREQLRLLDVPAQSSTPDGVLVSDDGVVKERTIAQLSADILAGGALAHASTHQNGGADEINVAGLSGVLADPQTPLAHTQAATTITVTATSRMLGRGSAGAGAIEEMVLSSPMGLSLTYGSATLAIGATTDTPQLARLGLGAAAHATALLYAYTDAADGAAYADSQVILSRSAGAHISILSDQGEPSRIHWADGYASAAIVFDTDPGGGHVDLSIYHGATRVLAAYDSKVWLPTLTGPSLLAIDAGEFIVTDTTGLSPQFAGQTIRAGVGADMVTYWDADNGTNNDSMWRWTVADATGTLSLVSKHGGAYTGAFVSVTADGVTTANTLTVSNTTTLSGTVQMAALTGPSLLAIDASENITTSTAALTPGFATLGLIDTNASHYLRLAAGSDLTADRTLTLTTGDADRTITLSGNPTLADWFDQSVKQAATPQFAGIGVGRAATRLLDIYSAAGTSQLLVETGGGAAKGAEIAAYNGTDYQGLYTYSRTYGVGTWFGLNRQGNNFLLSENTDGYGLGTIDATTLVLGTNNTARLTIAATGEISCHAGDLRVIGAEGADAILNLWADESDDAGDRWRLVAYQASTANIFQLEYYYSVATTYVPAIKCDPTNSYTYVAGELRVSGDGGGAASTIALTNASQITARSTGVGTIKFDDATARDNAGFIKIYIGTTAYYIPVFSAI
jgi:hypothetical protein